MFTPELVGEERGEYVLVAKHSLSRTEGVRLSINYNRARVVFGAKHLPPHIQKFRDVYNVHGQNVPAKTREHLRQALMQVLVKCPSVQAIESAHGVLASRSEVSSKGDGLFSVSVPTTVVDSLGEQIVYQALASLEYYALWSGVCRKPKAKWKLL